MKKKFNYFLLIVISLSVFSCDTANPERDNKSIELEYKQMRNIPYGDNARQVYDIYLPKNRNSDTKIVILIHGGGWFEGDKVDMNGFKDFIRQNFPDMAVINMNYRLATNTLNPHPMQVNDISALVHQLKTKKKEYVIGEELSFIGVSAGGHLSLLWSYAYDTKNQVNWVCSIVGPTNLNDDNYLNTQNQDLKTMLGRFGTDTNFLKSASPLYQVKITAPATALFYGGVDPLVPNSQWRDLDVKLTELKVPHELKVYDNEGHGWILLPLLDTSIRLKAFIEKYN
jgi:acetyl esterase/lipase